MLHSGLLVLGALSLAAALVVLARSQRSAGAKGFYILFGLAILSLCLAIFVAPTP